tara:strand:+ start:3021 stop:4190 length:1170 start_codon:yes stop_codon:yes gene_type:complete
MIRYLFIFIILSFSSSYAQDWTQIGDFPESKRDDGVSFKIGNIAYFGTGLDESFTTQNDFFAFDLSTEIWTTIQNLPSTANRQYATASGFNNKGYVFGGTVGGVYLNDLWLYDALLDTWEELESLPGEGRAGASNFILNNQWFIVGGKNSSGVALNEVWKYDFSSGLWSQMSNIPNLGMWRGMAFSYNNVGYVGLGQDANDALNSDFWEYDFSLDSWLLSSWSITPRIYPAYAQINGKVFVYGGVNSLSAFMNTFEAIDLGTNQLLDLGIFPSDARRGTMTIASNDAFYLTTGLIPTARMGETWKVSNILSLEQIIEHSYEVVQVGSEIQILNVTSVQNFKLISITGKEVRGINNSKVLNVSTLKSGLYFYCFEKESRFFKGKIYLEKQ